MKQTNRLFPNYLWPRFRSESWCSSFHMQINFHSHENEFNLRVNENCFKMTLLSMSSRSSVDRVPARCSGGHGFDSCRDSDFSLSHARVMYITSPFILDKLYRKTCHCSKNTLWAFMVSIDRTLIRIIK